MITVDIFLKHRLFFHNNFLNASTKKKVKKVKSYGLISDLQTIESNKGVQGGPKIVYEFLSKGKVIEKF